MIVDFAGSSTTGTSIFFQPLDPREYPPFPKSTTSTSPTFAFGKPSTTSSPDDICPPAPVLAARGGGGAGVTGIPSGGGGSIGATNSGGGAEGGLTASNPGGGCQAGGASPSARDIRRIELSASLSSSVTVSFPDRGDVAKSDGLLGALNVRVRGMGFVPSGGGKRRVRHLSSDPKV